MISSPLRLYDHALESDGAAAVIVAAPSVAAGLARPVFVLPAHGIGAISRDELRDVLVHVIEEYARHAGHADLLRECIDGRTGQ